MFTSFNHNIFNNKEKESLVEIPADTEVIFVSDMFLENHLGGAELTTEALVESCPMSVFKLHSSKITMKVLQENVDKYWIFGNYTNISMDLIPSIVANINYSIVEFDYKYCRYRSPQKHSVAENVPCNCQNDVQGKMISAFMYGSKSLWWMSEKQMEKYHTMFPFLNERHNVVLSSVFNEDFFRFINYLRQKNNDVDRKGNLIVGSTSWIKGTDDSITFCKNNEMDHEIVWNLSYQELLEKLASVDGLVFLPKGHDTCPRLVIEAKLLGCKLYINENVQHSKELWFDTQNMLDTESYLYAARNRFWNGIKHDMSYNPTLSGYTTTNNCIRQNYPFIESIVSLSDFCDEIIVVDGGSDDGTWEKLSELSAEIENLKIYQNKRDWSNKRHAVFDGMQKALARSLCTSDYCWQQDVDEVVHEDDYEKIKKLTKDLPSSIMLLALPVVEYWGRNEKVRVDVNPWKWRLSKNHPHITHGIPAPLRKFDKEGNLYSAPGSDGCDYVRCDNYEPIPFSTFYTADVDNIRSLSFDDDAMLNQYENWFNGIVDNLPGVHHYSWYDIDRKIRTYKNYWSKHWQSLYDIVQEDTVENNMFFDKLWCDVTDEDISTLSEKLEDQMGGWVFHKKVNFNLKTPSVKIKRSHPTIMKERDWLK